MEGKGHVYSKNVQWMAMEDKKLGDKKLGHTDNAFVGWVGVGVGQSHSL